MLSTLQQMKLPQICGREKLNYQAFGGGEAQEPKVVEIFLSRTSTLAEMASRVVFLVWAVRHASTKYLHRAWEACSKR